MNNYEEAVIVLIEDGLIPDQTDEDISVIAKVLEVQLDAA